jgi:hypothetical protein
MVKSSRFLYKSLKKRSFLKVSPVQAPKKRKTPGALFYCNKRAGTFQIQPNRGKMDRGALGGPRGREMGKPTRAVIGGAGAVFLSVFSAAIYDFIKGNPVFSSAARSAKNFAGALAKDVSKKLPIPLWAALLLALAALAVLVLLIILIRRLSAKTGRRRRSVRRRTTR